MATYNAELDEDAQVAFKGKAKMFVRTYSFLAAVLPYSFREWELLATFLNFLVPKLPAPQEEDLSKGVLESIDMDSYRVEVQAQIDISLADEDATLDPVPLGGVVESLSRRSTCSATSSRRSTTNGATSPGKTPTRCGR